MKEVIFCRGIQGSGKTTFASSWAKVDSKNRIRISYDDLRNMVGEYWVPSREEYTKEVACCMLSLALDRGKDVVIDNMNLSEKSYKPFKDIIEEFNSRNPNDTYKISFRDFKTPLHVCIERDSRRANPIGEKVIKETYNRYKSFYNEID